MVVILIGAFLFYLIILKLDSVIYSTQLQIFRNYRKSKTQQRDSMACMAEIMGRIFDQSKCRNFHAFRSLCWPFSYDSFGISVLRRISKLSILVKLILCILDSLWIRERIPRH